VEEKFVEGVERESKVVLWTDSATRCRVVGVRVVRPRSRRHIFEVPKMWQRGMLRGRQSGTRNAPLLEERKDKLVWMQRRKGTERHANKRLERRSKRGKSGAAQRGKSTVEQCTVRRTGKRSKRGG